MANVIFVYEEGSFIFDRVPGELATKTKKYNLAQADQRETFLSLITNGNYFMPYLTAKRNWLVLAKYRSVLGADEAWLIDIFSKIFPPTSSATDRIWARHMISHQFKVTADYLTRRMPMDTSWIVGGTVATPDSVESDFVVSSRGIPDQIITSITIKPVDLASVVQKISNPVNIVQIQDDDRSLTDAVFVEIVLSIKSLVDALGKIKTVLENPSKIKKPRDKIKDYQEIARLVEAISTFSFSTKFDWEKRSFYNPPPGSRDDPLGVVLAQLRAGTDLTSKNIKRIADYITENNPSASVIRDISRLVPKTGARASFRLDPWQKEAISIIERQQSILIIGPTSGGKTTLSMYAIHISKGRKIVYVAPTFHLALQEYSNIVSSSSFKDVKVSLVTGTINSFTDDATLWIGTPDCLNSYFSAIDFKYEIGIFDEIHTLSTEFDQSFEGLVTSRSISNLMTRCTSQLIALSATVHPDDIILLQSQLASIVRREIQLVNYTDRSIVLHKYTNTMTAISDHIEYTPITGQSIFHLLKTAKDFFPALFFSPTEAEAYNIFINYIEWLEKKQATMYSIWTEVVEEFEAKVSVYNRSYFSTSSSGRDTLIGRRDELAGLIVTSLKEKLAKCPAEVKDELRAEIKRFTNLGGSSSLPIPCEVMGKYYCVGTWHEEYNDISNMMTEGKAKVLADKLIEAEGIKPLNVRPILELINRGLQFGISIILPTMPFVVQAKMLELLKTKKIAMLFCSKSFSMGINMPVKSVIIASQYETEIPTPPTVSEIMQMEGRAGRRGMGDTYGNVIYWNLSNASHIDFDHIPRIKFPKLGDDDTNRISHIKKVAVKILVDILNTHKNPVDHLNNSIIRSTELLGTKDVYDYIEIVCQPIILNIDLESIDWESVMNRIKMISKGNTTNITKDAYQYASDINSLKKCIQELHTKYHTLTSSNGKTFLNFIKIIFERLHQIMFEQLRFGFRSLADSSTSTEVIIEKETTVDTLYGDIP